MCGIVGVQVPRDAPPPDWDEIERMLSVVAHRGPDGWGQYRDDRVGLGHVRLSIIDPEGGAQPMGNEDGSVWISFNGEIFNYVELKADLERHGARFRTSSDTEVVLRAYETWGSDAWARFNGQFALAVRDRRRGLLWLVRDRVGIHPLYVAEVEGAHVFASEVKALMAGGRVRPRFSDRGLHQIFTGWAPVAPDTPFRDVESVGAGCALRIDGSGERELQRYWTPDLEPAAEPPSFDAAVDELSRRLDRAISLRLRADVPVGAYLSGGLDSSLVTQKIRRLRGGGFSSFSVRFADERFDEGDAQAVMVRELESRHEEVRVDGTAIAESLPEVVWHTEMPLLRTSPVPLFRLSRKVRDSGMKVVLTGEGADELLGGYQIFKEARLRAFWAREPDSRRRPRLFDRLYPYVGGERTPSPDFWRSFFGRGLTDLDDPFYSHRIRWANTGWTRRFLADDLRRRSEEELEAALDARMPAGWENRDLLSRAQALEMEMFMGGYLLAAQGDRVAMANGVEGRYPFLDPDVVDFCLKLPPTYRLRALSDKRILRALASRELPRSIWDRPKQPYRAPIAPALFGPDAPAWVGELSEPGSMASTGLFSTAATRLVEKARDRGGRLRSEREEMALVGVLTLRLLHRSFVEELSDRITGAVRRFRERERDVRADYSRHGSAAPMQAAV